MLVVRAITWKSRLAVHWEVEPQSEISTDGNSNPMQIKCRTGRQVPLNPFPSCSLVPCHSAVCHSPPPTDLPSWPNSVLSLTPLPVLRRALHRLGGPWEVRLLCTHSCREKSLSSSALPVLLPPARRKREELSSGQNQNLFYLAGRRAETMCVAILLLLE